MLQMSDETRIKFEIWLSRETWDSGHDDDRRNFYMFVLTHWTSGGQPDAKAFCKALKNRQLPRGRRFPKNYFHKYSRWFRHTWDVLEFLADNGDLTRGGESAETGDAGGEDEAKKD